MFEDLVAKIRGVNSWPETLATISSVAKYQQSVGKYGGTQARSCISFWYRDGHQNIQSGEFTVDEDSPLFNEEKDSTFTIRYNPARPNRYWSTEYSPTYDRAIYIVLGLLIAGLVVAAVLQK